MKILTLFLLIGSWMGDDSPGKSECQKFRSGKFVVNSERLGEYTLERKDSIQIETVDKLRTQTIYRITWTGDCSYTLRPIRYIRSGTNLPKKDVTYTVEITEVDGDTYKHISRSSLDNITVTGTITKVE